MGEWRQCRPHHHHLDATSITVHREDRAGPVKGIVVDYTGTISNYWIDGDVSATWPGHSTGASHMRWRGLLLPTPSEFGDAGKLYDNSIAHAQAWSMCQAFGEECSAAKPPVNSLMVIGGKIGSMQLTTDYSAVITTFVDTLPGGTVVMRRFDMKGTFSGATGIYTGKRIGNRISGTFKVIWPGQSNNAMESKWNATVAPTRCDPAMNVETEKNTGTLANMIGDKAASLSCYTAAANKGDGEAEDVAGYYSYVGWGGAPDYQKAQMYLMRSAAQENVNAMLSLSQYYRESKWGPPNLLLANYYGNRAELHKRKTQENAATFFFFRGDDLAATVAHEESVISLMGSGTSRVDAEAEAFKREDADNPSREVDPEKRCPAGSPADYYKLSYQQREQAESKHAECVNSVKRAANQGRDYQSCVQRYKDSNAIEENCKFN
ncbi:hypothetical protein RBB75_05355 [Tunturibacter empetritectus]|uniref:Uncharacterized protein n=1 Tax=Tunturiibacter empetritectus TaxID=3069691 RepID=A0AAU7ZG79_9BACT